MAATLTRTGGHGDDGRRRPQLHELLAAEAARRGLQRGRDGQLPWVPRPEEER